MNIRQLAMRVAYETANLFRRGGNLAGATVSTFTAANTAHPAVATDGIGNEFTIRRGFDATAGGAWVDGNVPIFDATYPAPCTFAITDVTLFITTGEVDTATLMANAVAVTDAMDLTNVGIVRNAEATTGDITAVAPGDTLTLVRAIAAPGPYASVGEVVIRCLKIG
jgi:hypothetical protein